MTDTDIDTEWSPIKKGIFIPHSQNGAPFEITVDFNLGDINRLLNCEYTDHDSIGHLDKFSYKLCLFVKDSLANDDIKNPLATLISLKTMHNGNCISGPAILIDDKKDITLEEFKKIITLSRNFDYKKYKHEQSVMMKQFIKKYNK